MLKLLLPKYIKISYLYIYIHAHSKTAASPKLIQTDYLQNHAGYNYLKKKINTTLTLLLGLSMMTNTRNTPEFIACRTACLTVSTPSKNKPRPSDTIISSWASSCLAVVPDRLNERNLLVIEFSICKIEQYSTD